MTERRDCVNKKVPRRDDFALGPTDPAVSPVIGSRQLIKMSHFGRPVMNVDESSQCNPVPPPHLSEEFKSQYPVPETVVDEAAFRRREANAVAIGTAIGCAEKKIKGMWNQLMLEIYPVWSHRSKRGDDRVKGRKIPGIEQETWTPWNEDFCARTGLHPKAVERHIMAYRVEVLGLSPQPSARKKTEVSPIPSPPVRETMLRLTVLMRSHKKLPRSRTEPPRVAWIVCNQQRLKPELTKIRTRTPTSWRRTNTFLFTLALMKTCCSS